MTTVFLDCETLGTHRRAPIWEFAAVRIESDGTMTQREHFQILHDPYRDGVDWVETLPDRFARDYLNRYNEHDAVPGIQAAAVIAEVVQNNAVIMGSNPSFDMERLGDLLDLHGITPGWHYHPHDVPTAAVGWLAGQGRPVPRPWKSDAVSLACDIDPADYDRHTAMGDVEWCWDLFIRIGGTW